MKRLLYVIISCFFYSHMAFAQNPEPFSCVGSDGFGYYISSASSTQSGGVLTYSNSRLSKITTATGSRVTLCTAATIGVALNSLAFNPHDNFLYAVSRYDATQFSGKLYRIGENCQKVEISIVGPNPIIKFATNNINTIDLAGGNISSGTFDLDNHMYVNTSFTNVSSTGFTNKLQKILINNNTATVLSTVNLTCPSCSGTGELRITDVIFDEASGKLFGSNKETDKFYSINTATGVITEIGNTGITSPILGIYKNRDGNIRAINQIGNIYSVNQTTGLFTFLIAASALNSGNADAASGCYAPPRLTGHLFLDANGLTDNIVNGIGVDSVGGSIMYVNLVKDGLVVKTDILDSTGFYQFLGLFSGNYEVQVSSIQGTIGQAPPAQNLPSGYQFVGDHLGTVAGNDGTPNGSQNITIAMGIDIEEVNFGVDGIPMTVGSTAATQMNPGGSTQVPVPALMFSDPEEPFISNITIQTIPDAISVGSLYYNGIVVFAGQNIPNYDPALLTVDPVNGDVTVSFSFFTTDMAGLVSNVSNVNLPFVATLPVTLVSFSGKSKDGINTLRWKTSSEENCDYFEIQRQIGKDIFEPIGRVSCGGNTRDFVNYTFEDKVISNFTYYRLKQFDKDGLFEFSAIISVQSDSKQSFSLYPTLSNDFIFIENGGSADGLLEYQIINSRGQRVMLGVLSDPKMRIEVNALLDGAYYVQINDGSTNNLILRFIKI